VNPTPSAPPPAFAVPAADPERPITDEERYAAELDSAFDDYDTVPRAETPPREAGDTAEMVAGATAASAASTGRSARERSAARRASTPVHSGDDDMGVAPAN